MTVEKLELNYSVKQPDRNVWDYWLSANVTNGCVRITTDVNSDSYGTFADLNKEQATRLRDWLNTAIEVL